MVSDMILVSAVSNDDDDELLPSLGSTSLTKREC